MPSGAAPATVGELISRTDRYSRAAIEAFAALCNDANPLHSTHAPGSRFGGVIASGEHTSSMMLGLATSHFTRPRGGPANEVLVLHVNFAFRSPVFADEDVALRWQVAELSWNGKLGGHVVLLNGEASTARARTALVARASLLVKAAA
ncbi:MaoC family dehydratase [Methylibium sp.]|uniref:MaoC family dehydratase n=1 Tax=Methylibium sp. TaxID=2067992 RepID=UPI003D0EDF2D